MSTREKEQGFDLSSYEAADTGVMHVRNPGGALMYVDGKPFTITLYGPGSVQYVKAQARMDSTQATRTIALVRGQPAKEDDIELMRAEKAEKLAACTHSIQNFPVEARALYANPKLRYITEQVEKFIEDWANFMGGR